MFAFHAVMHKRKMAFVYCFASKRALPRCPPIEGFAFVIIIALKTSDNKDVRKALFWVFGQTQLLLPYSEVHRQHEKLHIQYNTIAPLLQAGQGAGGPKNATSLSVISTRQAGVCVLEGFFWLKVCSGVRVTGQPGTVRTRLR